jgi:hypothetical protein
MVRPFAFFVLLVRGSGASQHNKQTSQQGAPSPSHDHDPVLSVEKVESLLADVAANPVAP